MQCEEAKLETERVFCGSHDHLPETKNTIGHYRKKKNMLETGDEDEAEGAVER